MTIDHRSPQTSTGESEPEPAAAPRLRTVLRINAGFSTVTGLVAALDTAPVARLLGVEQLWLIRSIGVALLGFAAAVVWISGRRVSTVVALSGVISLGDLGWVAATVGVIAAGWLSPGGALTMGLIGVAVLGFAIGQLRARSALARPGVV